MTELAPISGVVRFATHWKWLSWTVGLCLVGGLLAASPCRAAMTAYLQIAECPGSATPPGEEIGGPGLSAVYAESDGLSQVFNQNAGTLGRSSGIAQESVLKITKGIDKATPCLRKAAATGQVLTSVVIIFQRPSFSGSGAPESYYVVTLTHAIVTDIHTDMKLSLLPENASLPVLEDVSFTFDTIEWNWLPDNVVAQDKWKH